MLCRAGNVDLCELLLVVLVLFKPTVALMLLVAMLRLSEKAVTL